MTFGRTVSSLCRFAGRVRPNIDIRGVFLLGNFVLSKRLNVTFGRSEFIHHSHFSKRPGGLLGRFATTTSSLFRVLQFRTPKFCKVIWNFRPWGRDSSYGRRRFTGVRSHQFLIILNLIPPLELFQLNFGRFRHR